MIIKKIRQLRLTYVIGVADHINNACKVIIYRTIYRVSMKTEAG